MISIRFLKTAQAELDEAVLYYNGESPGLGNEFLVESLNRLESIVAYPRAWHLYTSETRRCQLHRFPYAIVYLYDDDEILVIAVAHMHREPDYWRDRL